MVEIAEDNIKVDSFSTEDVSPFRLWKFLWGCGQTSYVSFRESDVLLKDSESFSCLLPVFVNFAVLGVRFDCIPWEIRLIDASLPI